MADQKDNGALRHRIWTIVGIVLCVILIPVLIVNCTLLIKGLVNKDEVPTFGSLVPLIVLTDSMHEEFPSGSLIFSKETDPQEIAEGDIISFYDPASKTGAITTHKVERINRDENGKAVSFTTKGTANNTEDTMAVPAEKLVGRYTGFHIKGAGSVAMFMQTTPGFILCVFVPLLLMVSYDIIRRKMFDKKHKDDKDELLRELEELRKLKAEKEGGELGAERTVDETGSEKTADFDVK